MNTVNRLRDIEHAIGKTILGNDNLLVIWPHENSDEKISARLAELKPKYPGVKESDLTCLKVIYDDKRGDSDE
ncbi:MAG TPA: hypothetical protein PLV50_15415 [Smithella sp.]|jgi:hypothetical protein|nr:hypothetical protein [Smithella sp.]